MITYELKLRIHSVCDGFHTRQAVICLDTKTQCTNPERAYRKNCCIRKRNHKRREIPVCSHILQVRRVDEYIKS